MHKILIENITKMCQFPNGITLCILHITETIQYTGWLFFQYVYVHVILILSVESQKAINIQRCSR